MGNFWLKLKIWTKIVLFTAMVIYVLMFFYENHSLGAQVWVYPTKTLQSTVLFVASFSFLAGVLGTILVRTTARTIRQVRELKDRTRSSKLERAVQDMQTKAAMLRAKPAASADAPPPESDITDEGEIGR